MTTSFAHLTRGHFSQAVQANPGGAALGCACAALIPWCWWSAFRGRLVGISQPTISLLAMVLVVAGISLAHWLMQIFSG